MILTFLLEGGLAQSLVGTLPLLGIVAVFYFFMIRPQAQKQKKQVSFISALGKGDEVVTNSGMIGRINKIEDNVITLQIDTKTFIKVLRSSISNELTESFVSKDEEK
jgi:preprotein translocase subunit YajC